MSFKRTISVILSFVLLSGNFEVVAFANKKSNSSGYKVSARDKKLLQEKSNNQRATFTSRIFRGLLCAGIIGGGTCFAVRNLRSHRRSTNRPARVSDADLPNAGLPNAELPHDELPDTRTHNRSTSVAARPDFSGFLSLLSYKFITCEHDSSWRETTKLNADDFNEFVIRERLRSVFGDARYSSGGKLRSIEYYIFDERPPGAERWQELNEGNPLRWLLFLRALKVASDLPENAKEEFRGLTVAQLHGECKNEFADFVLQFAGFVDPYAGCSVVNVADFVNTAIVSTKRQGLHSATDQAVEEMVNIKNRGQNTTTGIAVIPEMRDALYKKYASQFGLQDLGIEKHHFWLTYMPEVDVIPIFERELAGSLGSNFTLWFSGLNEQLKDKIYEDMASTEVSYEEFVKILDLPISKYAFTQSCEKFSIALPDKSFDERFQDYIDNMNDDTYMKELKDWKEGRTKTMALGDVVKYVGDSFNDFTNIPELCMYRGTLLEERGQAWFGDVVAMVYLVKNGYINMP